MNPHTSCGFAGSWIHPKEKEEAERRESRKPKPKVNIPIPITIPKVSFAKEPPADKEQQHTSSLSEADKKELQNVKQLCLTVIKGQKRLKEEMNMVKESFERNPFMGIDNDPSPTPSLISPEKPQVSMQDVQNLEENQRKNLKAHLIALDMKEQGKEVDCAILHKKWSCPA